MSFISFRFAAFVAVCLLLYYIVPKRFRYLVLLAGSYVYYFLTCGKYIIYILMTTVSTYIAGTVMFCFRKNTPEGADHAEKKKNKAALKKKLKAVMIICLLFNFGILVVLKYSAFIISNVNLFNLTFFNDTDFFGIPQLVLPLGVSFYTFQSMGYIIDLFYMRYEPERNPFRLALFVSFFPQIVQGPISRYNELSPTLFSGNELCADNILRGGLIIIFGLFKKLVIADRVSSYVSTAVSQYATVNGGYLLLALFLYSMQLYADFSGGIDVAAGVARMFGVKLTPNFIRPFFSKSVAEYWRRWHISLSTWFRDYLFYPISISKTTMKQGKWVSSHVNKFLGKHLSLYIATFVVWFTTGLWHGAEWRYVVWGLINGFIMCFSAELEPLYAKVNERLHWKKLGFTHRAFDILRTFWLMTFLRVFDLSHEGMGQAAHIVWYIFTRFGRITSDGLETLGLPPEELKAALAGCVVLFIISMLQRKKTIYDRLCSAPEIVRWCVVSLSLLAVMIFGYYGIGYNAGDFIYMKF